MSRPAPGPRNPLLECAGCHAPVVKTDDQEFVCVSCGWKPRSG